MVASAIFRCGDRVERVYKKSVGGNYWKSGVVVMVVPAGVSPYALYLRWFKSKGECKMLKAKNPLMHKERYIVEALLGGRKYYYCPCGNTIKKV